MYQPLMSEENVKRLYFLKLERKKPMTKLLDEILEQFFKTHPVKTLTEGGDDE